MKIRKSRTVFGVLIAAGIIIVPAGWLLLKPTHFKLPGSSARLYGRMARVSERVDFTRASPKLAELEMQALENHLRRSVRSAQLALVTFEHPDKVDFDSFSSQVISLSKRDGFVIFLMRPVPSPMRPTAYQVFVEKSGEGRIRALIESPNFKSVPSPYE